MIPRNVRLSEAPSHGLPISRYDPNCRGAVAYRKLAAEFDARMQGEALPDKALIEVTGKVHKTKKVRV